jgi:hypothetical protein
MKRMLWSLGCSLALATAVAAAADPPLTFYLQLVHGGDDATPPTRESKAVGPKLAAQFRPVFAWKHYWVVERREVKLAPGKSTKVRLSPHREVEIDLRQAGHRGVTVYSEGRAVSRTVDPLAAPMTLIGGERDARHAWFVVVRRDQPTVK